MRICGTIYRLHAKCTGKSKEILGDPVKAVVLHTTQLYKYYSHALLCKD